MSKFFKALEKADQERGALPEPEAAEVAAPARTEAQAARVEAPPARLDTPTARVEPPPARRRPVPAAPPPSPTPVEPVPPMRAVTPAVAPPAPVVAEPAAAPAPAPPSEPMRTYGAPVRERQARFGARGFAWQLQPDDRDDEPGRVDDHLVSVLEPTSVAADQYRAVRLAIETYRHERGTRVVGVTSPGRGDGRTITAINLAGALAQAPDARVVLVEGDLRHPGVAPALGLAPGRGLSAYLLDSSMAPEAVITRPSTVSFAVVTAGAASSMPYELLKSPRLAALLGALRERFDYVVVDTPPALPYPDVGILRDIVDGFVVVVRANHTSREALRDGLSVVGRARSLGLIFNDDERQAVSTVSEDVERPWKRFIPRPLGASRVA